MTFPLGSLRADGASPGTTYSRDGKPAAGAEPHTASWKAQAVVFAGGVAWLLLLLALATHHIGDPAFSTSGGAAGTLTRAGAAGAWVSDILFVLFGYSAWWIVLISLRAWLGALARLLRGHDVDRPRLPTWTFWLGVALLL